ncbi:hypothetical protein ACHAXA_006638 [Cyclostephanos tholiformis]|uniref:OsmC-like protein n=1 Tax=Cyclostephanos tholiformis TaxID=382380 RepID=A0ABD3RA72_9STRA
MNLPSFLHLLVMSLLRSVAALSRAHRRHINPDNASSNGACRGGGLLTFRERVAGRPIPNRHSYSSHPHAHDDSRRDDADADVRRDDDDAVHYLKRYSVSGTGRKSSTSMTTNTGHVIATDVPIKMGGEDSAPQPVEYLLASLIGCTQATAMFVSRCMRPRLYIDGMNFDVHAYRDERGSLSMVPSTSSTSSTSSSSSSIMTMGNELPSIPSRLLRVYGTVTVYFKGGRGGSDSIVTKEQLSMLRMQTEARCPIANMMHSSGCVMDVEWVAKTVGEERTSS